MNLKLISNITSAAVFLLLTFTAESAGSPGVAGSKSAKSDPPAETVESSSALASLARRFGFGSADDMEIAPAMTGEEIREMMSPFSGSIIDTIIIKGNSHTNRNTIVREMATQQGEKLSGEKIARDESYLRGLGYFSSVTVRAGETAEGRCRVNVKVDERPGLFMKYPFPVLDYSIDKGFSYGFRWRVKNFRGAGEDLLLTYKERSEKERGGGATWFAPWVGGFRMRLMIGLFSYFRLEKPEFDDFLKEQNGARVSVGLPLTKSRIRQLWFTPSFSMEERVSRLSLAGNTSAPEGIYIRQMLASVGGDLIYDSRDNIISPYRGVYARLSTKRYFTAHGHDQKYSFYSIIGNIYRPASHLGTFIFGLRFDRREGDLPSFFRMRLGGKTDLRGFYAPERDGLLKISGSLQLRKRIYGPAVYKIPLIGRFDLAINSVLFVDNGSLMERFGALDESQFFTTGGFGFEIISPIQNMLRAEAAFCRGNEPVFYITSHTKF